MILKSFGATIPPDIIILIASSTEISTSTTSDIFINNKYPEVGIGVVGINIL